MEGDAGAQFTSPIFIHPVLSGGFHEVNSLARKRDLTWHGGGFLYNNHQQKNLQRMTGSPRTSAAGNWNPKSWDWDSARFVARPAADSSDGALRLGNSSPVAEAEENWRKDEGSANPDDEGENLTLKLGGRAHPLEEPAARSHKRVRSGSPGNGSNYPMCQVDDCKADLSNAKDYHRRHKVCEIHSKTSKAVVGSQMQRFCQQCSRFHSLGEFDEGKRSCRRRLAGHNRRRRKTQPKDNSSPLAYPSAQENLNIVDVLSILARLQGHGEDKSNSSSTPNKERIIRTLPHTNSSANLDLNVSQASEICSEQPLKAFESSDAPPTMDLLGVLSSGESSESSEDYRRKLDVQKIKSSAFPSPSSPELSDHSVDENCPGLQLQLFGSSSKYQSTENSSPTDDRSPLFSPMLQRLFPLHSEAEGSKPEGVSLSRTLDGAQQRGSFLELSRPSERIPANEETSSSGSDRSGSSSDSENRTGRIIFKLFGKDPSSFPGMLRTQLLSWLSHSPSDMESYIRPGCVVLSIYLSMPSLAWANLQLDLAQRVKILVESTDSDFWRTARFTVHAADQLASHKDGKIRLCRSWRTRRAPEIISVSPLAVVSGRETRLTLRGRNLTVPGTTLRCTYNGRYTSKVADSSSFADFREDSSVETFIFPGGTPNLYGRCFLEVDNAFKGNSFPLIVADEMICREIRVLEAELEDESGKRELALHFLNELGWLFQRKSAAFSLFPGFSASRFRFLLEFSVDRNWSTLVEKLLDCLIGLGEESREILSEIGLLHRAVKRRSRTMVGSLLHYSWKDETGASRIYLFPPNAAGPAGITPLHLAASMEDSEDLVDGLTGDPQQIGLDSWDSLLDEAGQSPHSYAAMKNNHSYNKLVARKLDRGRGEFSINVDSGEMISERPAPWSLRRIYSQCAIFERRMIKSMQPPIGFRVPLMHPILAIACVCVCVCVFLRGSPVFGTVASPFRWECLHFGPR